jgi:hypothetical protein
VPGIFSVSRSLAEFDRFGQGFDGLIIVTENKMTISQAAKERPQ